MKYVGLALLILIALGAGWWLGQHSEPPSERVLLPNEQPNVTPPTEPPPNNPDTTVLQEPVIIEINQLPDGQQTLLRTLGIDGETITFTPTMVACAETEMGATRLDEIIAGDTPSFGEGFTLVNCYRQ